MPDAPRWSKADTHCVWCGKPKPTDGDFLSLSDEEHSSPCLPFCWCESVCWGCPYEGLEAEARLLSLRATVEAQGKVIERLRDGWDPTRVWWQKDVDGLTVVSEDMSPAEQVVLYGEVVNEAAGDE